MALADSMRSFLVNASASRKARHDSVKANRVITAAMRQEYRDYLGSIHEQNQANAQATREFLKASGKTRKEDFKATMKVIHSALDSTRQAAQAIKQDAQGYMNRLREDREEAQRLWAEFSQGKMIEQDKPDKAAVPEPAVDNKQPVESDTSVAQLQSQVVIDDDDEDDVKTQAQPASADADDMATPEVGDEKLAKKSTEGSKQTVQSQSDKKEL
jgi:hypothetical protein